LEKSSAETLEDEEEEEGRKEENKSLAAAALTSGFNPRLQAEREDKLCE